MWPKMCFSFQSRKSKSNTNWVTTAIDRLELCERIIIYLVHEIQ